MPLVSDCVCRVKVPLCVFEKSSPIVGVHGYRVSPELACQSRMWYWRPTTCTPPGVYRLAMKGVLVDEGVTNLTSVTTHTSCVKHLSVPVELFELAGL